MAMADMIQRAWLDGNFFKHAAIVGVVARQLVVVVEFAQM